jgi:PilZ domain
VNPRTNRQDKVKERRATSRYNLVLPVEISLALIPTAARSILVKTRDISTHGFYFNVAQKVTVGTKFEFSIALPIEITGATQAYISGTARAVRVEEAGESHAGRSGVGAIIESYEVSRTDSANA